MRRLTIISFFIFLGFGVLSRAQNVSSHYFLHNLPESNKLNPALTPNCNFYLDLPGIGSTYVGTSFDFGFQDAITLGSDGSTLQLPFNSPELWNQFYNNLNDISLIETDLNVNLLGFGFKFNQGYFHFNVSDRVMADMRLPSAFLTLNNLGQDVDHDLSGLEINTTVFREIGAGISLNLNSELTVGAKLKLLQGLANAGARFNDFSLYTSISEWRASSDVSGNISSPQKFVVNADGDLELSDEEILQTTTEQLDAYIFNFENLGLAVDLGAEYRVLPNLLLSASLVDLGSIKWKTNATNYAVEGEATFNGLKDEPIFTGDDSDTKTEEFFTDLSDSLLNLFGTTPGFDAYSTKLVPKLYVGAEYQVTPVFSAGVLSKTRFYKTEMRENIYFSANLNLYRILTAGAHYNWAWTQPNTIGFTVALKLAPLQIYFSTDMMPSQYRKYIVDGSEMIAPTKFNGINAQVGVNLLFGCRKKQNVPLYDLNCD